VLFRKLAKYWALFKISFKDRISSPSEALLRTVFFGAVIFIFSRLWASLASDGSIAGGPQSSDLVWYLFFTESIVLSLPPLTEQVDQEIQSGNIAYQLVRPMSYVLNRSMSYLGDVAARFTVNASAGFLMALFLVGHPPQGANLWMMIFLLGGAFLIHLSISLSISMLGFWVEDTLPFFWIYSKMAFILGGLFMPIDFYPEWLRRFSQFLPFRDSVYSVAQASLQAYTTGDFWILLSRQLGWAIAGFLVASVLYRTGVTRLEARGG
jgi:ABC-2 type transport system permease protein